MVGDDARADGGAVRAGIRTLLLPPPPPRADNGLGAVLDLVGIATCRVGVTAGSAQRLAAR